jgi:hypothetical protein
MNNMTKKKEIDLTVVDEATGQEVLGGAVTNLWNIFLRIIAVFAASGLTVIGAGSVVGVDTITAVTMAGLLGVATVVERLARAFLDDGKLSAEEINAAFAKVDKKSE